VAERPIALPPVIDTAVGSSVMPTIAKYRARAQECIELAKTAREPEKAKLLEIANAWLKLAESGAVLMPPDSQASKTLTTHLQKS
jgi:hypothetical protein